MYRLKLLWTFHNKYEALVIHDHHFCHLLVYREKMNFCGSLCGLLEYFHEKKTLPILPMQITWPWPTVGRFSHGLITYCKTKENVNIKLLDLPYLETYIMPWLCVDHMIQQGVWPMGFSYPDPQAIQTHWQNPDPLVGTQSNSHCYT